MLTNLIINIRKDINIYFIFLVSFFSTTGRGITLPFLPLFLHKYLSMSTMNTGNTLTLAISLGIILSFPLGKLADRYNHRFLLVTALLIFSLSFILMISVLEASIFIFSLTMINMAASVSSSIIKCYISEHYSNSDKNKYFSINYTIVNIGWITGPTLGAFFYSHSASLLFYLSAFCGLLALVLTGKIQFKNITKTYQQPIKSDNKKLSVSRWIVLIIFTTGIFLSTFVYGRFSSCISQILITQVDEKTTSNIISVLVTINAATIIFFQIFTTSKLSKLKIHISLLTGMIFLIFGIIMFSIAGNLILLWSVGVFIFSFGEIIFIPLQYRLIDSIASIGNRALCFSFQNLGELGGAINPLVTAFILTNLSVSAVYYSLIMATFFSVTLFFIGSYYFSFIKQQR
ncbi:efflux MFS transporter YdeE [Candidatus Hepatincola sp. Pdp]